MKHHGHDPNCTCPDCRIEPFIRNNYFTGKLMTARDFFTEQDYFSSKLQHHHQRLHGWGVVCGLEVVQHGTPECRERYVIVRPGTAIDCCGREILVTEEETLDLSRFEAVQALLSGQDDNDHRLQICIRYRECPTEEVPVLYDDCGCDETQCAPNRILESYAFDVLVDQPLEVEEARQPEIKHVATINPPHAWRATLHSSSRRLYALSADPALEKTVFQLETDGYSVVGTHTLPARGLGLAVSNDGRRLYAISEPGGAPPGLLQLVVIDTQQMADPPIRTLEIPGSSAAEVYMAVAADGRLLTLLNQSGDVLIWPATLNDPGPDPAPETANLGVELAGLAVSSDGQYAYAVDNKNNAVVVLDTANKTAGSPVAVFPAGADITYLALVPSSGPDLLVVASHSGKSLYLVNPGAASLLGSAPLSYAPLDLAVSPGGAWAYVLEDDAGQGYVQPVSLARIQQSLPHPAGAAYPVGRSGNEILISAGGRRIYVAVKGDMEQVGAGGVVVLDVDEQRCLDLLSRPCPECDAGNCVILATIENYRAGFSLVDQRDAPVDPASDRAARMARIDNRLGRRVLPSVQALAEAVECLLEREPGGPGTQGPPGPPGPPGDPGPGIEDVVVEWIPCGQEPEPPQIVVNEDGTRTLVLQIPDGCQDLVVVNEPGSCGEAGSVEIETIDGQRTLVVRLPPPVTDLAVDIHPVGCDEEPSGSVQPDEQGRCHLVLNIPTGCEQPPSEGRSTTGTITVVAPPNGQINRSPDINHCLGSVPVGLMLAEDTGECDQFEMVNFIGPSTNLFLLRACVRKPYNGTFFIEIAQDRQIQEDQLYDLRWVAVAGAECAPDRPPRLDVNLASREDLIKMPGIGKATADRILVEREARPFTDLADFRARIKPTSSAWEQMRDSIIVVPVKEE